jgi:hypothetical protein
LVTALIDRAPDEDKEFVRDHAVALINALAATAKRNCVAIQNAYREIPISSVAS